MWNWFKTRLLQGQPNEKSNYIVAEYRPSTKLKKRFNDTIVECLFDTHARQQHYMSIDELHQKN